jgi:hypothetical protein
VQGLTAAARARVQPARHMEIKALVPTNVVVFIHGITPLARPTSHTALYKRFWNALTQVEPALEGESFARFAHVEWGHLIAGTPLRADAYLAEAERHIAERVSFERVKAQPSELNTLHQGLLGDWSWMPGLRPVLRRIREQLVMLGLADAVYYCSEEGERAVRLAVSRCSKNCDRCARSATCACM